MRIIAGIAKGTSLSVPRDGKVRPTSDRVREAVFSSLGDRVIGADVLDLFAGTGALGLEAASRGAHSVLFLEHSQPSLTALYANIVAFKRHPGEGSILTVRVVDVFAELARLSRDRQLFSLIFADPPYGHTAQQLLDEPMLPLLLVEDGGLVLESAKRDVLILPPSWRLSHESVYGDTRVSYLSVNRIE